jgi:hypothetical protein
MAKQKRGRLSSIDLLPEQAEPHVLAALKALRERKKPQQQILAELNAALADYGIRPTSPAGASSSFSATTAAISRACSSCRP